MAEPPTFSEFFFFGLLRQAGWPHNDGVLTKDATVDPRLVDEVFQGLAQIGIVLGAGRPALGAQLLADIFRVRDWSAQPLGKLLGELDPSNRIAGAPTALPWETIVRLRLAQEPDITKPEVMPWEMLEDRSFRVRLHLACAEGLIWGLLHPGAAEAAINRHGAELSKNAPTLERAGVEFDAGSSPPNMERAVAAAEDMVNSYETKCRQLIPLPDALRRSPELAGLLADTDGA